MCVCAFVFQRRPLPPPPFSPSHHGRHRAVPPLELRLVVPHPAGPVPRVHGRDRPRRGVRAAGVVLVGQGRRRRVPRALPVDLEDCRRPPRARGALRPRQGRRRGRRREGHGPVVRADADPRRAVDATVLEEHQEAEEERVGGGNGIKTRAIPCVAPCPTEVLRRTHGEWGDSLANRVPEGGWRTCRSQSSWGRDHTRCHRRGGDARSNAPRRTADPPPPMSVMPRGLEASGGGRDTGRGGY